MLAVFAAYLAGHLALYVTILRYQAAFQRERTVLLYHALPGLLVVATAVGALIVSFDLDTLARIALVVGLHGIYSLSFLELWTLTQIGFSLAILAAHQEAERTGKAPDWSGLERTGAGKKAGRILELQRAGLVAEAGGIYHLSGRGRLVAGALAGLARLTNLNRLG
jgi:hypothetical protein